MNNFSFLIPIKATFNFIIVTIFSIVMFSSCSTTMKHSYYFKTLTKDTTLQPFVTEELESKIRKGDLLGIKITSLNPLEDVLFNSATISDQGDASGAGGGEGFYVDKSGNIEMHKLGVLHIEGMTLKQVETKLVKDLTPYLKDIIVSVNFLNHKVLIFGAVGGGAHEIKIDKSEKISIIEALALSGNIGEDGDKSNVLIIRETENGKQMKHVNLEDHSIFSSPWYYLKPDDMVYVSAIDNKLKAERIQNRQQTLTYISYGLSIVLLIYTNFLRK